MISVVPDVAVQAQKKDAITMISEIHTTFRSSW